MCAFRLDRPSHFHPRFLATLQPRQLWAPTTLPNQDPSSLDAIVSHHHLRPPFKLSRSLFRFLDLRTKQAISSRYHWLLRNRPQLLPRPKR